MRLSAKHSIRRRAIQAIVALLLIVAGLAAENTLAIERVTDDKCQVVLELTDAAGGIQFTIVGSSGMRMDGMESGRSVAGPGWIVAWNAVSDGEVRVVIMGRTAGSMPAGRYELLTWNVSSPEGRGVMSVSDVVLADDDGAGLLIEGRGYEWYRSLPAFTLLGNYPNPFNPSTVISFTLERRAEVSLEVYDIVGRRLDVVVDGSREGGTHQVPWTTQGKRLATGVYIVRLTVDGRSAVSKMNVIQ